MSIAIFIFRKYFTYMKKKYADKYKDPETGITYVLVPFEVKAGDRASEGCIFKHWGGACCSKPWAVPSCTPEGLHGRHVWQDENHQYNP